MCTTNLQKVYNTRHIGMYCAPFYNFRVYKICAKVNIILLVMKGGLKFLIDFFRADAAYPGLLFIGGATASRTDNVGVTG